MCVFDSVYFLFLQSKFESRSTEIPVFLRFTLRYQYVIVSVVNEINVKCEYYLADFVS